MSFNKKAIANFRVVCIFEHVRDTDSNKSTDNFLILFCIMFNAGIDNVFFVFVYVM